MELLFIIALVAAIVLWFKKRKALQAVAARERINGELVKQIGKLEEDLERLKPYQTIIDAEAHARNIIAEAKDTLGSAKADATERRAAAHEEAERIIAAAKSAAEKTAGDAYTAMNRAQEFSTTAQAMKNVIDGYGDTYIVPTFSLLDELADDFGHTEAGAELKKARNSTRALIKAGRAAICGYVEDYRRETAIRFIIDAFNGKVDSILSRSKADNHGKLEQELRDAFALVNHNGSAFRNARITDQYLESRLAELKWAATANALRDAERDEQRRIREQIREEEKARREYERAMKEAAKEEDTLRKAMDKARQEVARSSDAEREVFEAKLADLQQRLTEAEARNQRALSMAQQTKTGHVYVISNIGSFGEEVFKIGMTRRLEPTDRVRELGDASVPFEFDVHAMIWSEDAPALERALHKHFLRKQMNKVNPRKEFFRLSLADIRCEIETYGVQAHWTMTAAARDYRETLRIEEQILNNPDIEREWTQHQLEVDPVSIDQEEAEAMA